MTAKEQKEIIVPEINLYCPDHKDPFILGWQGGENDAQRSLKYMRGKAAEHRKKHHGHTTTINSNFPLNAENKG